MKKNYVIILATSLLLIFTQAVFAANHATNNAKTPFVKATKTVTAQQSAKALYASYIQIINLTDYNDFFLASNTGGDPWYGDTVAAHSMYPLASDTWGGNTFIQVFGPDNQLVFNSWVGPFDQVVISYAAGKIHAAVKK